MTKQEKLRFCKGDFASIAVVIVLAVLIAVSYLPKGSSDAVEAQIYQNGELLQSISLQEDTSIEVNGKYTNVITVRGGAISITESDCPGEDCVHSGAIHTTGRSIVCLPNEVEIRVVGASSDVDFVVG